MLIQVGQAKLQFNNRWPQTLPCISGKDAGCRVGCVLAGRLFLLHLPLVTYFSFRSWILEPNNLLSPQGKRLLLLSLLPKSCFSSSCRLLLLVTQSTAHSGDSRGLPFPQGQMTFALLVPEKQQLLPGPGVEMFPAPPWHLFLLAESLVKQMQFYVYRHGKGLLRSPASLTSLLVPRGGQWKRACEWVQSPPVFWAPRDSKLLPGSLHLAFHNSLNF